MTSTKAEQSSFSSLLTRLDRDSWLQTEDALIGILGDKDAKAPLIVTREECVGSRTMGGSGSGHPYQAESILNSTRRLLQVKTA